MALDAWAMRYERDVIQTRYIVQGCLCRREDRVLENRTRRPIYSHYIEITRAVAHNSRQHGGHWKTDSTNGRQVNGHFVDYLPGVGGRVQRIGMSIIGKPIRRD